ncbi:MAG: hypothetical protein Kow0047_19380 [Anaerolineae bacterium]
MRIPGSYEDLIEQARQARSRGQADVAVALYARVIDRIGSLKQPLDEPLVEHLVVAADELQILLDWLGDHARARALCERMVELDPEDADFWLRRAITERIYEGEVEEGLTALRELVDQRPQDPWFPLELAARLVDLKRWDEALQALDVAEQRVDNSADRALVLWTRFRALSDQGRIYDAARAWETARKLDPFFKQGVQHVYEMFIQAGDYESALLYLDMEDNALLAGYYLGLVAHYQGDSARAEKIWQRTVKKPLSEFESGLEAWAMAQLRLGEKELALSFCSSLANQGYTTMWLYVVLGLVWAVSGGPQQAKDSLESARRVLRQVHGPYRKLPRLYWREFDELVSDQELKAEVINYFDVDVQEPTRS